MGLRTELQGAHQSKLGVGGWRVLGEDGSKETEGGAWPVLP